MATWMMEQYHGILRFILFEAELYPEVARMAETHTFGRGFPCGPACLKGMPGGAPSDRGRPGSGPRRSWACL